MTTAFITGSTVYGKPNRESDVDLVCLVNEKDLKLLSDYLAPDYLIPPSDCPNASIRVGNLNLILVTDPLDFEIWRRGTAKMQLVGRIFTRELACEVFKNLRAMAKEIKDYDPTRLG